MMDDMVQQYNDTIVTALDKQIPEKTKLVRDTHHNPGLMIKSKKKSFYNVREKGIGCEISQNTHGGLSTINIDMSLTSSRTAQQNYLKGKIEENKNDYKAIFNIANSLLFRKQESPLPDTTPLSALAKDFSEFFEGKIDRIMLDLATKCRSIPIDLYQQS